MPSTPSSRWTASFRPDAGGPPGRSTCLGSPQITIRLFCAEAREEHLHLRRRGVLRLVEDDEGVGQRAAAHEGDRRDLDLARCDAPLDLLGGQAVVERVVDRAEIGIDLLLHVAGQEAEPLARLDRGARQDQPLDAAGDQLRHRLRHGEIGLAGARRPEREDHVVRDELAHIMRLRDRARDDRLLARADHDRRRAAAARRIGGRCRSSIGSLDIAITPSTSPIDLLAADHAAVELLQHFAGMRDGLGRALDHHALAAGVDIDAQPLLEREQVRIIFAEELRQELGLVERRPRPGAVTGLGGDGLAAHAVLSGCGQVSFNRGSISTT
jgi:hypothetical protein